MKWIRSDGGRKEAGRRGTTGDCVCRAIAIATGRPYSDVYFALNDFAKQTEPGSRRRKVALAYATGRGSSARTGVLRTTTKRFIEEELGWIWTPTMFVGSGCRVHLRDGELPGGRLIVNLSRHVTAVIDGVIHDLYDPSRGETRCVYGYWRQP